MKIKKILFIVLVLTGAFAAGLMLAFSSQPDTKPGQKTISGEKSDHGQWIIHSLPKDISDLRVLDMAGQERSLPYDGGQWVLLNLWARWCPPCVAELPSLDRLQSAMGQEFQVIALATDNGSADEILKFAQERTLTNLMVLHDPKMASLPKLNVKGLPSTILISPDGKEIGRIEGEAVWDSPNMIAAIKDLIKKPQL